MKRRLHFLWLVVRYPALFLVCVLLIACGGSRNSADNDQEHQRAAALKNADAPDTSKAPGVDEPEQAGRNGAAPLGAFNLRSNQIRTRHLFDGSVTSGKVALVATTVTIAAAATTGSSAANATIAGGFLLACTPSGNQDQFLDNAVLNADGSITLTLGAAATAINTFRCVSVKPNAQGVS
jgi:hypothetical protein